MNSSPIAPTNRPRPIALIILDGWGYREEKEANAIAAARTPNWNDLWQHCPHTLISGCGHDVGLPDDQMGNSEVGHLTMGAGRIIYQDLTRIDEAIATGEFFKNPVLLDAIAQAKQKRKALHILGLLSPGGVHSHEQHIHALLELCAKQQLDAVYIHPFLDGRDTPPRSALSSLQALEKKIQQLHCGKIVSIIGRYYAMAGINVGNVSKKTYDLLTSGKAEFHAENAIAGLALAYARGETDEFVQATTIHGSNQPPVMIEEDDVIVFMNFRSDRAREITQAMIDPDFAGFQRTRWPKLSVFVCLTEYDKRFPVAIAFPPQTHKNILAEYLSKLGLQQLRIAETEKYAHVTFFFNGGIEIPFPGENRLLIPSSKVATYDQKPEMSAFEITEKLVHEIESQRYDLIICNFANPAIAFSA